MAQTRPTTDDLVRPAPPAPRAADREDDRLDDRLDDTVSMEALPPDGDEDVASDPVAADLPLLDDRQAEGFLDRWSEVQARFVDDPQAAVRDGDSLVAEVMQALAERFSQHKRELEVQWQRGDEPQTEELRLALQQYRSFFQRLLAT